MTCGGRGRSRILITGSIAGFVPGTVYNASKAFLDSFSFALRAELKDTGITVTCLMPGATETDMIKRMMAGMGFADQLIEGSLENYRVGTPLRKNAQVDDIAAATLFLLSDQASHVTMHELVVDGGTSLGA